jgi:PhzF family phenazine biosynthesis protein
MPIPQYVVDAFASQLFRGNPAAVCLLQDWLPEALLQAIAAENNLSETAFLVPQGDDWQLRWFTPQGEIALCGHATLASAFVLARLHPRRHSFRFHTLSGALDVSRTGERFVLDFPARQSTPEPADTALTAALGQVPAEVLRSGNYLMARLADENAVLQCQPDFAALKGLEWRGVIITAQGRHCDFVSRFFAPRMGIDEDPVTGSAHCSLVPYWATRLGRLQLHARQLSRRGADLHCELRGERVLMAGTAVLFAQGEIHVGAALTPQKSPLHSA